jgi:hypothetical protein
MPRIPRMVRTDSGQRRKLGTGRFCCVRCEKTEGSRQWKTPGNQVTRKNITWGDGAYSSRPLSQPAFKVIFV